MEGSLKWELVNPEGPGQHGESFRFQRRPETLDGKTVVLRWNGKHNGDVFLNKVGELVSKSSRGARIVRAWEVLPETNEISCYPARSEELVRKMAALHPDLVIGTTAD